MEDWESAVHKAIGAFFREIPAASKSSMNIQGGLLDIRVQYQGTPTKNTLEKPKKKVPPSRIRRNWQRLAKFLKKTEPELLPTTFHKIPDGVTRVPTPLDPPLQACGESSLQNPVNTESDTNSVKVTFLYSHIHSTELTTCVQQVHI